MRLHLPLSRFRAKVLFLLGSTFALSCASEETEPVTPSEFVLTAPANLGTAVPFPQRNPFTREGVLLGKKLFYDPILSGNNQISCASCHQPEKAFSDGRALTTAGASRKPLLRHAPALQNLAWMQGWFWDGGAKDLESLALGPLTHEDEMAQNLKELVLELQNHVEYPAQFKAAFGTDSITSALIARALAQFQRTLITGNSAYDRHVRKEPNATLNNQELRGLALVRQQCAPCHATDSFTDQSYRNNGLAQTFSEEHEQIAWGRGRITHRPEDIGKYKVPTLRNIMVTAPYMHDGCFETLQQVLDHYTHGIVPSPTLDPTFLRTDGTLGLTLTQKEKVDILSFLNTLTDWEFLQNPAHAPLP
ncbi:cytochrome-c peroxidase [Rufibacter latericius]|uniref:Cytochrome-c peroxidase n=1 Tax=Rufibacter latericius TaxID=2487040 RepID=A0A3M9MJX7_9BACT|nr:cytochrome c peroxidase [Rufibacter latericius]RNI25796.1 cytochrome-c peroxidase [Rufibacter latericius]